jgi:hypothetical protein
MMENGINKPRRLADVLHDGIGGLIENIYYYYGNPGDDPKNPEDAIKSGEVLVEEDIYYYDDEKGDGTAKHPENNSENTVTKGENDAIGGGGEILVEEDIYFYYDEKGDGKASYPEKNSADKINDEGREGAILGEVDAETNTAQDMIEEEDIYYYYDKEEDVLPNETLDVDTDKEEVIKEEDSYYYYVKEGKDDSLAVDQSTKQNDEQTEEDVYYLLYDEGVDTDAEVISEVVEEDEYYYYYHEENDNAAPDGNVTDILDPDTDSAGEPDTSTTDNGDIHSETTEYYAPMVWECPGSLMEAKKTYNHDIRFTFAAEFKETLMNDFIRKVNSELLPHVATATLACNTEATRRRLTGQRRLSDSEGNIFLLRFRENGTIAKVSECGHHVAGNTCNVFGGTLLLVSDRAITAHQHMRASQSIKNYVEGMEMGNSNDSGIYHSEYIGPEMFPSSVSSQVDNVAVVVSVLFLIISLIFLARRQYTSRRKVRFNLVASDPV